MTDEGSAVAPSTADAALPPQHPLSLSILLHLLPGIALTIFIVLAAPVATSLGFPVVFALFAGIGLVIVPLELGVLLVHAKRTTGAFRFDTTVLNRETLPGRRLAVWGAGLTAWFLVLFVASTALFDRWLAETFFAWLPEAILQFSAAGEAGEPLARPVLITLLLVAFVFNGFVGPIVEELYFRGFLLPRIERYGRWSPLVNTTLFSLYHLWTPWQNPARILGFLPIAWAARRFRSVQLSIVAHVAINLLFLAGLFALFLSAAR